jgi:ComF family protein
MTQALRRLAQGLSDAVFPPSCVHCRGLVEREKELPGAPVAAFALYHVCGRCEPQIDFVKPPHCSTCGSPFYGEVDGERTCPHCEGLHPAFREGRTAVLFKGPARSLVIELKYHRGLHVLADVEEILRRAAHVCELASGAVLVPVPLHPRKERERGYNQTALLAEVLARVSGGGARVEAVLRRIEDTATQTAFDRRSRMANLKNAFALAHEASINPDLHYVIVDDVFTTGSTLNSCARTLRRAGCLNLDVVTFGHG